MTKIVGLIGYPLGHSVSPVMHNAAFKNLHLDFDYTPFEVPPSELEEALNGLRALHVAGFNVTIPHKETVLPLLNEITPLAKIIGAVNCVVNQNGCLVGYNTDGAGFTDSLKAAAKFDPAGKNVVVLGAGGASRAITVMLAESKVKSIVISDVVSDKACALADYVGSYFGLPVKTAAPNGTELQAAIGQAALLVNTTPIGMYPKSAVSPLDEKIKFPSSLLVYDLVYNPRQTKLLKTAAAAGCQTCSGLDMLVRQGALAFSLWTGHEAPFKVMFEAAEKSLG
ncbi:shikimate dehydrogenase [Candidatus Saganbacteria bacterium]|nr:shikimate dehydrogenase [Candidatus Saganbacteria bacterium]